MPIKSVPQYAVIAAATGGNNTLVALVTAKKIRVLSAVLVASGGDSEAEEGEPRVPPVGAPSCAST